MNLHTYKDADALSQGVAVWMSEYIGRVLMQQDRFTLALSGGSTPQKLHKVLASSPFREKIDWSKIHFFWGDERAVPFEDERNNAKMAFDSLLDHVPVKKEQIHLMRTDIEPEAAAKEYEAILHKYFDGKEKTFDLVLLGMGDDGHTLSLFPGTAIVHEKDAWTKSFYLAPQSMYRLSLTAPVVNLSAAVAFLVTGKNKADTLKQVLNGSFQPEKFPSQLIQPLIGELHWFLDEAAAAGLKS
jgi:6-phosphogluconolactonase